MASDPNFRRWVDAARATPIGNVVTDRKLRLRGSVEMVGACPNCGGEGNRRPGQGPPDRFSVNTSKNVFRCRKCNSDGGDVIELVMWLDGCDFLAACQLLTGMGPPGGGSHTVDLEALGRLEAERSARRAREKAASDAWRQRERRWMHRLWCGAHRPHGTPVEAYLGLRGLSLPPRSLLRFDPAAVLYGERAEDGSYPKLHTGPCMYAAITGPEGRFSGLHMTWIDLADADGKARIFDKVTGEFAPAKKVRGSQKGGHLDLTLIVDPVTKAPNPTCLVIGEGIETTLTVRDEWIEAGHDVSRIAFWSAINLDNFGGPAAEKVTHPTLRSDKNRPIKVPGGEPAGGAPAGIQIPETVALLYQLGDGDSDPFTTTLALARAAKRWARPGRVIRDAWAPAGTDFNTLRRQRLAARRAAEAAGTAELEDVT